MRAFGLLAVGLFAATAIAATSVPAEARDGCGRGYFWNGYQCAPSRRDYGPPQGYYGPPPDRRGYDRPIRGESSFGQPETYFRPYVGPDGRLQCRQRGFTVQDGICKRYRGY